jgi:predicted lysophospholipase L1 biosynthesis ABC-type transport system permease subunit
MNVYWKYPVRALARERLQTLLAILCVSIGVMAIVALQLVGNMVSVSLTGNIRALNGGDIDLISPRITASQLATFAQLEAQGQITSYTVVAADQGSAVGRHPLARIDRIRAVDPAYFPLAGAPIFEEPGNSTLAQALAGMSVVLTHDLAQQLGVHAGNTITLILADGHPTRVKVGGVIQNASLFQEPQVLLSLTTLPSLLNASAPALTYDEVYMDVPGHSAVASNSLARQLNGQFSQGVVVTTSALLRSNQEEVQSIQSFLRVVALIALLIGGMGIANTMQTLLRRRTTEIAMLKSAGFTRRNLYALYGMQALLYGVIGGMVGAIAGVGASLLLKDVIANAFALTLTATIDPVTIVSGIALGGVTALIFGLLPIVQASQVRPLAVLREQAEGKRTLSRLTSILLIVLLAALFFALALAIVRDVAVALEFVAATCAVLALLGLLFVIANTVLSHAPVILLPRWWNMHVRLALRNFGRQPGRMVAAEIALFVGIFAVGFILLLGQEVHAQYSQPSNAIDASVGVVHWANAAAVANQLRHATGVTRVETHPNSLAQIVAINGAPLQGQGRIGNIGKVEGYDLANGQTPAPPDISLDSGRMLEPADANTTNVVIDRQETDPTIASTLRLGDRITVQYTTKFTGTPTNSPMLTLTIVGFATDNTLFAGRAGNIFADNHIAMSLAGDTTQADILIHVDPQRANEVLAQILTTYGSEVWVHNLGDVVAQEEAFFSSVMLALEVVVLPALFAALLIIANIVALAMLERRRELAILKAVGHTSRGVLANILIEQGFTSLTAATFAVVLALLITQAPMVEQTVFGGSNGISTPSLSSMLSIPLAAEIVAVSVAICLLITATVAWSATHVRPLAALRYE